MQQKAYTDSEDSEDILSFLNKEIENIYIGDEDNDIVSLSKGIDDVCEDIKNNQGEIKKVDGFTTDLSSLIKYIPFWENGRLIVVAARPGMGKTALGIHEAVNACNQGKPTLFFTLEMTYKQMTQRILLRDDNMQRYMFKANNLTDKDWNKLDNSINDNYDKQTIYKRQNIYANWH